MHPGDEAALVGLDEDAGEVGAALDRLAHDLMPPYILATMPRLYDQEQAGAAAIVHVKLFTPDGAWTWYLSEYDPDEEVAFGYCCGPCPELGYVSLAELREARGPLGLRIERDLYWTPKPLGDVMARYERNR